MTAPYGDDETRRLRAKYSNVPSGFGDQPASQPSPFADTPPAPAPAPGAPAPGAPTPAPNPAQGAVGPGPAAPGPVPQWAAPAQPAQASPVPAGPSVTNVEPRGELLPEDGTRSARIGVKTEGPQQGWRAVANKFGLKLSKGTDEIEYDRRIAQIQRTLRAPKTIAVVSGKGNGSKTITTLAMGATMATQQRGLKIVAASIDPLGNLTDRTRGVNSQPARSVVSLASDPNLHRDSDVSSYLLTDKSGLRVLGPSSADGAPFLTPDKLDRAHTVLRDYFNITLLDFGLNIDSPVYHKGLELADQLVITASTAADSIDELHKLIRQLHRFGKYGDLLRNAVVVFTQTQRGDSHIDVGAERTRIVNSYSMPVVSIPWDAHISEGGPMSLDLLDKATRLPYVWLAAEVMEKIPD